MKFALTGASGRVGRLIVHSWTNPNSTWNSVPLQYRCAVELISPRIIPWNVANGPNELLHWMDKFGALDTLIVLSGVTPATSTDMMQNIAIAKRYLDAARVTGIKRVLLASSAAVYGVSDGSPMDETHLCVPLNNYGKSKLAMEAMVRDFAESTKIEVCCLRIGNIAGADALLLNAPKATPDAPLIIDQFANGSGPLRSYIGPTQFGDVLAKLACYEGQLPPTLNVAGTSPVRMEDLAIAAAIPWRYELAPKTSHQSIILDCSALEALIDMPNGTNNAKSITLDWLGANKNATFQTPL